MCVEIVVNYDSLYSLPQVIDVVDGAQDKMKHIYSLHKSQYDLYHRCCIVFRCLSKMICICDCESDKLA